MATYEFVNSRATRALCSRAISILCSFLLPVRHELKFQSYDFVFIFAFLCKWYRHFIIYFSLFSSASIPKRLSFVNKTKTLCRAQRAKRRVWDTHSELAAFITHYYYFNSNRYENICMIFIAFNLRPPFALIASAGETLRSPSSDRKRSDESRYRLSRQVHIGGQPVRWLDLPTSLLHIQIQAPLTPLLITTCCPRESATSCH